MYTYYPLKNKICSKKRNWSDWKSIMFVQDFRAGINTYELLRRNFVNAERDGVYERYYVVKDEVINILKQTK
jgi:uncharacterized protein (DUF1919 family)